MADYPVEQARAIIQAGIENNAWDGAMPEHDPDIVHGAGDLVQAAAGVAEKGNRSPAVKEILFAAKVDPVYKEVCEERGVPYEHAEQPAAPPAPAFEQMVQPGAAEQPPGDEFDVNSLIPGYDDLKVAQIKPKLAALQTQGDVDRVKTYEEANEGRKGILEFAWTPPAPPQQTAPASAPANAAGGVDLRASYESGTIGVERATQEALSPPPQVPGEAPSLMIDITAASDSDVSRWSMDYHSRFARAVLLVSREEGRAAVAETLKHDAHADAFKKAYERIRSGLDKQTAAALTEARQEADREASSDDAYRVWRDRQVSHEAEARVLKSMAKGYESAIDRLSREQSRRERLSAAGGSR